MTSRQPIERYQWPLSLGAGLLAVWLILSDRKRRPSSVRQGALAAIFSGFRFPRRPPLRVSKEYQAGNFEKAKAEFERRLQAAPDSDKLNFQRRGGFLQVWRLCQGGGSFYEGIAERRQEASRGCVL